MFSIQVEITVFSIHLMTIPAVLLQSGTYENLKYYYDQNIQDIIIVIIVTLFLQSILIYPKDL